MNKILSVIALLFTIHLASAQQELPAKSYKLTSGSAPVEFRIKENNQYEVILMEGTYEINEDEIHFFPKEKTSFQVTFKTEEQQTENLTLNFLNCNSVFPFSNNIYIVSNGEYYSINDLDYTMEEYSISVPKTDTLDLIFKKYLSEDADAIIERYAVPKNTQQVDINFTYMFDNDVLIEQYNAEEQSFTFQEETLEVMTDVAYALPIERDTNYDASNLSLGEEMADAIYDNYAAESVIEGTEAEAVVDYYETEEVTIDPFEFENLKEAVKQLEGENLLMIMNQLSNENRKEEYVDFVNQYNESLLYSYDGVEEKSRLKFYLVTKKDKQELKKLNIGEGVTVINSYKDVLHHENSIFSDPSNYYYENAVFHDIVWANTLTILNHEVKKQNLPEEKLIHLMDELSTYVHDLPQYGYKINAGNYTYNINEYYTEYEVSEDQQALITATPKEVLSLFEKMISNHKGDKTVDYTYANHLLNYITNRESYKMLFNQPYAMVHQVDFDVFDYVLQFHPEIKEEMNNYESQMEIYTDGMNEIIDVIQYTENREKYSSQIDALFTKALRVGSNAPDIMDSYLYVLEETNPSAVTEIFSDYFKNSIKIDESIVEQLDQMYSSSSTAYDWMSFKVSFANQCNAQAWTVYTEDKKGYVNEAIEWSKISLKLNPTSPYFLDTLAHLYFVNGQQKEAIKLQEQAVNYAAENNMYEDGLEELKSELARMKKEAK